MREIRTSSSMRGRRKRATAQRACALLYRSPWLVSLDMYLESDLLWLGFLAADVPWLRAVSRLKAAICSAACSRLPASA